MTQFCLESKIRHSTICTRKESKVWWFCLESKIRHSTIIETIMETERMFCLESKIRHSTIVREGFSLPLMVLPWIQNKAQYNPVADGCGSPAVLPWIQNKAQYNVFSLLQSEILVLPWIQNKAQYNACLPGPTGIRFCLESKIRHSTIGLAARRLHR